MSTKSKTIQVAKLVYKPLNETNRKILEFLQLKKEATYKEIADELAIDESNIGKHLRKLENEGLLIRYKKGRMVARWLGGVPAIENELMSATSMHIKASLLAESYDDMITHAFALFSLMFEGNYWELIMNFREGLTEIELGQRIGAAIPLDSIRRVLVICDAHNLIRINRIREPAEDDLIKLTEPLYRIVSVNRDFFDYMVIIRGLASAMQYRMEFKKDSERSHVFGPLLDLNINWFKNLKEFAVSKTNVEEQRVLLDMLLNYDYSEDLDRIHRHDNWRTEIKQSSKINIGKTSSHVLISDGFADAAKENMMNLKR
jgi:DNA-binding transcriptional ArsR family regulator